MGSKAVACAGVLWSTCGAAWALDPGIETIVVSGSRLARSEGDAASAVVTVPASRFHLTGANTIERTLNELPQFVPNAGATSNDPSNDGAANISLRGLGTAQTLVLLDGRRWMPSDGRGAVDLNVLPPTLVRSIEVITGGGSAVYGSDAIAGVVNVHLLDSFDGIQLDGGWAQSTAGDADEYSTGLTAGTTFDHARGSVVVYVGYTHRDSVDQRARRFSRVPLKYYSDEHGGIGPHGAFLATGLGIPEEGLSIVFADPSSYDALFAAYGYAPGSATYQAGIGVNADRTLFTIGDESPHSVLNYRGPRTASFNDRSFNSYNTAPDTALRMPLDRTSAYVEAKYAAADNVDVFLRALGARYTVTRELAPTVAGIALVPATNPHVPADLATLLASRTNPTTPFRYFKPISELGPRTADNDRDMAQATIGASVRLTPAWTLDSYVQYGRNRRTERQSGNVNLLRFEDLTFAADAGASICGDFDPFSARSLAPACVEYIGAAATNETTVDQWVGEATLEGTIVAVPAGDVRGAFGIFYKRDAFEFDADPLSSAMMPGVPGVIGPRPAIAGFDAAPNRDGDERDTDAFAELLIPLARNAAAAQALTLGLGYRYADYSRAGGVSAYKTDLTYQPITPVRVRGSVQRAVRAPSIEELFYPPVASQFDILPPDPCSASSRQRTGPDKAKVEALCLQQGLPAAALPTFEYPLRRVDGVSGGNPDLRPERADTYTLGIVMTPTPRWLAGDLRLSVDWYRIELDDGIGRWQADSAVDRCFDGTFNPSFDARNIYCTFFERRSDTGQIFARIVDRNIGGIETEGVDFEFDWHVAVGAGAMTIDALATHLTTWRYRDPSGGTIEYVGTVGGTALGRSLPDWKSLLNLTYDAGPLALYAKWQHIDGQTDIGYPNFSVPAVDYVGVGGSYVFPSAADGRLTLYVGIENLFDEDPPIFPSWQQANTDPSQYDVLGRRYFVNVSYQL